MTEEVNETTGLAAVLNNPKVQRQFEQAYLKCLEILDSLSKGANPAKVTNQPNQEKTGIPAPSTTAADYT